MGNVVITFFQQVFVLPHNALSSRVATLKLKKVEDSYSWTLGVGLGYTKD